MTAYKKKIEDLYPFHQKPISAEYWGSKIERKIVPSFYIEKNRRQYSLSYGIHKIKHKNWTHKSIKCTQIKTFRSMYR